MALCIRYERWIETDGGVMSVFKKRNIACSWRNETLVKIEIAIQ